MRVPLLDLRRHGPDLDAELEATFARVLRSGQYILGSEVEHFEQSCATHLGVAHAIGVSSGTDALLLALMALGIGPGDEVICPTFTFFATAGAIVRVGARPVFVDSCPRCFNLAPRDVEAKLTPRTRAIVPVHLFGQSADLTPLVALAAARGIAIVEDAAQSFGATYKGRRVGTFGAMGCYSFFPSKNLGALGDAGLLTTDDETLASRVRALRVHGAATKYHHTQVGGNFRIDALQAALLTVKLHQLDANTAARRRNAERYASGFAECAGLTVPSLCSDDSVWNQYVVRVSGDGRRDGLRDHLTRESIGTEVYYPLPLHLQPCFSDLGGHVGSLPCAERAAAEVLALPVFQGLRDDEQNSVVAAVRSWIAKS